MGGRSPFVLLFERVATLDSSPYFCLERALKFREEVCGGEEKIMDYCRNISDEAGKRTVEILGTNIMENAQGSLNRCAFSNVRLPLRVGPSKGEVPEEDAAKAMKWLAQRLLQDNDTFVALYYHARSLWIRLSGQIYLEVEDFVSAAVALKDLCRRAQGGEYRPDGVT